MQVIRLGTRDSGLALWQADCVADGVGEILEKIKQLGE